MKNTKRIITLYHAGNINEMLEGKFPDTSSWSSNGTGFDHYYEGFMCKIGIELDYSEIMPYTRELEDLKENNISLANYTFGEADVIMPPAFWYSISGNYIKQHIISITELFPEYSEEDKDGEVYIKQIYYMCDMNKMIEDTELMGYSC